MRLVAKLDEDGFLLLFRSGKWKQQWCHSNKDTKCGDWCPLFRETTADVSVGLASIPGDTNGHMFQGKGYYLACQTAEKPFYLFYELTTIAGFHKIDEFGNIKRIEDKP